MAIRCAIKIADCASIRTCLVVRLENGTELTPAALQAAVLIRQLTRPGTMSNATAHR
jgi:hypothetical protein